MDNGDFEWNNLVSSGFGQWCKCIPPQPFLISTIEQSRSDPARFLIPGEEGGRDGADDGARDAREAHAAARGGGGAAYATLCHHPGGFDSAVRAIRLLRARGIDVKINGSVTRQNLADMEAIYALGRELGAPVFETGFSSAWTRCSSRFWRWSGG